MNAEQIEAARALIDFARSYAADVYGDNDHEYIGASMNIAYTLDAADAVEKYLDGT